MPGTYVDRDGGRRIAGLGAVTQDDRGNQLS
jgi:hypothetical protein